MHQTDLKFSMKLYQPRGIALSIFYFFFQFSILVKRSRAMNQLVKTERRISVGISGPPPEVLYSGRKSVFRGCLSRDFSTGTDLTCYLLNPCQSQQLLHPSQRNWFPNSSHEHLITHTLVLTHRYTAYKHFWQAFAAFSSMSWHHKLFRFSTSFAQVVLFVQR